VPGRAPRPRAHSAASPSRPPLASRRDTRPRPTGPSTRRAASPPRARRHGAIPHAPPLVVPAGGCRGGGRREKSVCRAAAEGEGGRRSRPPRAAPAALPQDAPPRRAPAPPARAGAKAKPKAKGKAGTPAPAPQPSRARSFAVRTASTLVLVAFFAAVVAAGHVPLAIMVLGMQVLMCRELFALARAARVGERAPPGGALPTRVGEWYFFFVAAFWFYLRCEGERGGATTATGACAPTPSAGPPPPPQLCAQAAGSGGHLHRPRRARRALGAHPPCARHVRVVRRRLCRVRPAPAQGVLPLPIPPGEGVGGGGRGVGWGFRGVFWRARPRPQPPSFPLRLSQYAWTHLTLLFIFVPTSFFVSNIFDGIIW